MVHYRVNGQIDLNKTIFRACYKLLIEIDTTESVHISKHKKCVSEGIEVGNFEVVREGPVSIANITQIGVSITTEWVAN